MTVRKGRKHAAFVVGRHILIIAYYLLARHSTYHEAGAACLRQRQAEPAKRRCLDRLRGLGFQVTFPPLPKAA